MLVKKLDFSSPLITLKYKSQPRHSSIFGGISTIFVIAIVIAIGFLSILDFMSYKNPTVLSFNRFTEDAGIFPVNSSSMFSFIQLYNEKNIEIKIDFDIITIVGLNVTIGTYKDKNNLEELDHWIYGYCNNESDIKEIKKLIVQENFSQYPCIKKFYNQKDKKYYEINDSKFEWPVILHGQSRRDSTFYGIVIEKCRNNTLKYPRDGKYCKSNEEINLYMHNAFINYQVLDQNVLLNYENPISSCFYSITTGLYKNTYTVNNLNFNPLTVKSHYGIFLIKL